MHTVPTSTTPRTSPPLLSDDLERLIRDLMRAGYRVTIGTMHTSAVISREQRMAMLPFDANAEDVAFVRHAFHVPELRLVAG